MNPLKPLELALVLAISVLTGIVIYLAASPSEDWAEFKIHLGVLGGMGLFFILGFSISTVRGQGFRVFSLIVARILSIVLPLSLLVAIFPRAVLIALFAVGFVFVLLYASKYYFAVAGLIWLLYDAYRYARTGNWDSMDLLDVLNQFNATRVLDEWRGFEKIADSTPMPVLLMLLALVSWLISMPLTHAYRKFVRPKIDRAWIRLGDYVVFGKIGRPD
jgi:hypothetical protein